MELSSFWPCKIWSEVTLGKTQFHFHLTFKIREIHSEVAPLLHMSALQIRVKTVQRKIYKVFWTLPSVKLPPLL